MTGKRITWVSGGGSGIGLAGAEALAADGWTVAISGRRLDVRADAAERIGKGNSAKVDTFPVDVARADDVRAAARAIPEKHGQIDPLVNNAGLNVLKRFRERYLFGSREYRHWSKMLQPDDVGKTIAFVESMMSVDASSGGQNARWSTTGSRCTEWGT